MNTKPAKLLLAAFLSLSLFGCSAKTDSSTDADKESDKTEDKTEENVEQQPQNDDNSPESYGFELVKTFADIPADTIPQYVDGYFFIKDSAGFISIANQEGNVLHSGISMVTFFDNMPAIVTMDGASYQFDFSTGELTQDMGGIGGMNPAVYAYDESNGEVVTNMLNNEITDMWNAPELSQFEADEAYIIYSLSDVEATQGNPSALNTDHYYIWQIATNRIYGPYDLNSSPWPLFEESGYDFFSLSTLTKYYTRIKGLYPRYILEGGGFVLVNGDQTSAETYEDAVPVANGAVAATLDGKTFLVQNSPSNALELPSAFSSASRISQNGTLFVLNNGQWQLWRVTQ
jgi:hypothetical protein